MNISTIFDIINECYLIFDIINVIFDIINKYAYLFSLSIAINITLNPSNLEISLIKVIKILSHILFEIGRDYILFC